MLRRHSQRCADADISWRPQKYRPRLQLSGICGRPRSDGIQSYQPQCTLFLSDCHGLKNVSAKGMNDVTSQRSLSTHYAQLMTLEGRVSILSSASAAIRKVGSASVRRCSEKLADADDFAHLWTLNTPYTCNTAQRICVLKPQLTRD